MPRIWRNIVPNDSLAGLQFFQLFRYGSVFMVSIILPRAGLLPDQVGIFEAFLFFAGVVSYFWVTGLIQALLPLASGNQAGNSHPNRSSAFFNSFLLLLLFSILASVLLLTASPLLGRLLGQELPEGIVWLVVLYLVLFAPSTLVEYWYVVADRARSLVSYGIIAFTLQLVAVGLPVVLGAGVRGAIWGMIASGGFRLAWMMVILLRNRSFRIIPGFWAEHLKLGMPILVSVFLSGSAQYVSGFIVSARFDAGTFAIFRYGARELPLVALLAHALSNAVVPMISREGMLRGMEELKARTSRMASWMFPLSIMLVLSAYLLFPAVYGSSYLESAGVFNLYLLLITSRLLFPQTLLIAGRKTVILLVASAIELAVNIGLSLLLVNVWGIRGIALATVIAYLAERAVLIGYTGAVLGIRADQYTDLRKHAAWSGLLLLAYLAAELVIYPVIRGG